MGQAIRVVYCGLDDSFREFFAIAQGDSLNRYLAGRSHVSLKREEFGLKEGEYLFEVALYGWATKYREAVVEFEPPVLPKDIEPWAGILLIQNSLEGVINHLKQLYGFPEDWRKVEMSESARKLLDLAQQLNSPQNSRASCSASH